jgi:membrane fusion protein, multidrug efflux system
VSCVICQKTVPPAIPLQYTSEVRIRKSNAAYGWRNGAAFAWLTMALWACTGAAPPPAPPIDVTSIVLRPQPATVTLEYVASIEAFNTVEIRPRTGGLLERQEAVEGAFVKKGQPLFRIDPQPYEQALAQAKAASEQARATLQQAQRDQVRTAQLSKVDAASQQELDAVVARVDAGKAAVDAAGAAEKTAQLNLGYTSVVSPIDGVMGRAQVKVGALITAYQTLLTTVYSVDPMYVNFSISEQRLLEIQRLRGSSINQNNKNPPTFHLMLADGSIYSRAATLNFIDAAVDARTGTLAVRLTVANPDRLLRAGQFARVIADTQKLNDAMLLPQRAIQETQGRNFVWVVDAHKKAQRRDVVMGARIGEQWLVNSGLKFDEEVVIDGAQKLHSGSSLKIAPFKATPPPNPGT